MADTPLPVGNSGSQASTLIIRALALKEVKLRDWYRVFAREIASGLALGSLLGTIGVVCFGTVVGSMLPFLLRGIGLAPAASSAPFIATLVDVSGLIIYFFVTYFIILPAVHPTGHPSFRGKIRRP